ncbi:MAG: hypothetical protein JKY95_19320 [Planctomycetaceae bacterium]|nr:hypothetical protein [Planctomycetaceae bacterium]
MNLPASNRNQSPWLLLMSLLVLITCFATETRLVAEEPASQELEKTSKLRWYKGNMHTHSHWSDGDDYLEMIALWYEKHDYQFLVFTDHNVLADSERWVEVEKSKGGQVAYDKLINQYPDWVETRTENEKLQVRLRTYAEVAERFNRPEEYLLIQGEEISDGFNKAPIHMNVSNLKELIIPRHGASVAETIQNNVNAVMIQRQKTGQPMMIHLNHPNFQYAITAEDLMRVVGDRFFEVYNGHPGVRNSGDAQHASTERIWDIILTKRIAEFELPMMFGIATDDGHNYHHIPSRHSEPGRGWVTVLANKLQPGNLIEAMERGDFYASSGVSLKKVQSDAKQLHIEIDAVTGETYTIEFIGTRIGYDNTSHPVVDENGKEIRTTRVYSKDIGEVLQTVKGNNATYKFQGDEIYVRARITSSEKHPNPSEVKDFKMAWVQPVLLKSGKQLEVAAKNPVTCEGTYPAHLQGFDVDKNAIYWSFTTQLVKTDRAGKLIKKISVVNHHGDVCVHNNKIYVAVNLGKFNDPKGNADSWVYVYNTSVLSFVSKHEVQQVFHGAGGMGYHDGRFYVIGGLPGDVQVNYVYEYDEKFNFIKKHLIKSGQTLLGIQSATFAHGKWWFGCYGNPPALLVTDTQFNLLGRHKFDCSLGVAAAGNGRLFIADHHYDRKKGHLGIMHLVQPDGKTGLKPVK